MVSDREIEPISFDDAKRLWVEVVHKAVDDFRYGVRGTGERSHQAYVDAAKWIWSENEEFPSFLFLCDVLELDARQIRKVLHGYELSQGTATGGGGENVVEPHGPDPRLAEPERPRGEVGDDEATYG